MITARSQGSRIAVSDETGAWTYPHLLAQIEALRRLLGDRQPVVLVALPGGCRFTAVQLAALAQGATFVPIPARSTHQECLGYLQRISPDLVVIASPRQARPLLDALDRPTPILAAEGDASSPHPVWTWGDLEARGVPTLSPHHRAHPEGVAMIQFTSGSTGLPKGILISRENINSYLCSNQTFLERWAGQHIFCLMPQFHALGGTVALEHILSGASVHLANTAMLGDHMKRIAPCVALLASPTYLRLLVRMNALGATRLSSIHLGGAAIPPRLVRDIRAELPDVEIHMRYGLTETFGPMCRLSLLGSEQVTHAPGRVGEPVPGVEIQAGTEQAPAEVQVRSRVVALGQLVARDQWLSLVDDEGFFATGDLGYLDAEGRLVLRGRISAFIKRNGFRIDPFEIEALIRRQPGVIDVAVLGLPDEEAGQRVVACVEVEEGCTVTARGLVRACREGLMAFKAPERVYVMEFLPRTRSGKPDRVALRTALLGA